MHNLVKETTGIDFNEIGDSLTTAKEVVLRTLGFDQDNKNRYSIEACSSLGHLLNEVSQLVLWFS